MKDPKLRSFDYPLDTEGTRIAASARAQTNLLSKAEKLRLREEGMKMAYAPKQEAGSGH